MKNYKHGDIINISDKEYTIICTYKNHYKISNDGFGLVDYETLQIVLEPIYRFIDFYLDYYIISLVAYKYGLADINTGKILLKPEYDANHTNDLIKIYEDKLLLKEKLRQLKEDIADGL